MKPGSLHTDHLASLDPKSFQLDERTLSDYLIYLKELSSQVRFVDTEMNPQGDWSQFFDHNLSVFLASIADFNLQGEQDKFKSYFNQLEETDDENRLQQLFFGLLEENARLMLLLNKWYDISFKVQLRDEDNQIGFAIRKLVKGQLQQHLRQLIAIQESVLRTFGKSDDAIPLDLGRLDPFWFGLTDEELDQLATRSDKSYLELQVLQLDAIREVRGERREKGSVTTRWPNLNAWWQELDRLYITLRDAKIKSDRVKDELISLSRIVNKANKDILGGIRSLVAMAPAQLQHSLVSHADHAPQFSVIIAFLQLYERAKGDLNEYTQKHLEYYFREVLGENNLGVIPDKGIVWFQLADHEPTFHLSQGTRVVGGQDEEGQDYLFTTDHSLDLNQAELTDVKVLFVSKNHIIGEENSVLEVSNIYKSEVGGEPGQNPFVNETKESFFNTFGEEQYNYTVHKQTMEPSDVGFAMASPVLLLREGQREVTLKFKCNLKSLSPLVGFLEKFSRKHGLDAETGFIRLFEKVFNIDLSTLEGWYQVTNYRAYPDLDWTKGIFYIRFILDVTAPPIEANAEEGSFMEAFHTPWPVLRVRLTADESMYPYSYLKDLIIDECDIHVNVSKIKNLGVYNQLGPLDTANPFMPFGPAPAIGSYMLVGHDELFKKKLTTIGLHLEWQQLPRTREGFKEYFNAYPKPPEDRDYQVSVSALSDFDFVPADEEIRQHMGIFRSMDPDANPPDLRLNPSTSLTGFDLELLDIERDLDSPELAEFEGATKSGYLKFELTNPEDPFGHENYPELFAKAVVRNSKSKKDEEELPATPFIPELRSLEMNYEASTRLVLNYNDMRENDPLANEKMYHLTPFGIKNTLESTIPKDDHLLPQFDENGYLYLGLEGIEPGQVLTLYFVMRQNVTNAFEVELPEIKWRYLVGDSWLELDQKAIISDATDGFTTSGIITIQLPTDINTQHQVMPEGKAWLEVSVDGDTKVLSKTKSIFTQAVEVTWEKQSNVKWKGHLPPETINSLQVELSSIDGVFQPEATHSGKAAESDMEFFERISSRLRHKERAISPRDIELLVQGWYNDIGTIHCIPSNAKLPGAKPGEATVILLPKPLPSEHFYLPRFNYARLREIKERLMLIGSSFSDFQVVNPVFEQFLVSAKVKFKDNKNSGEYVRRLHIDLLEKMCPWFYDQTSALPLGGEVRKDEVLHFIESRDYVQFVTRFSLVAVVQNEFGEYLIRDTANQDEMLKSVKSTSPRAVLVPVAEHNFELVEEMIHESPEVAAIETMRLEGDFVILEDEEESKMMIQKKDDLKTYFVELDFNEE